MNALERYCLLFLRRRGYVVPFEKAHDFDGDYALAAQSQSYEEYVAKQTEGNRKKLDQVWADEATVDVICDFLRSKPVPVKQGLCHGSRNGAEVRWFSERLGIPVIGTDISDTASQFGLVQWDFHETNPEWIGKFDFIYTNSHDHARDPKKAFDTWVEQLAPGGSLIIEHTENHGLIGVTELDPFGVPPKQFPYVALRFGEGKYAVTRMIIPTHKKREKTKVWLFVVERVGHAPG